MIITDDICIDIDSFARILMHVPYFFLDACRDLVS